ncbi:MAG: cell division protein SepF [Candidatus Aenigmarchaeota archaeon]|nr:cell division protein SepF [Candidatus Aenigmarchaeota archaeon]
MVLGLFKKEEELESLEGNFVEVDHSAAERKLRINVRIEDLEDYRDVEVVQKLVREGNIVFLKIKTLREKNIGELKRAVQKLRKSSIAMGGDIVGVDDNFLILCPQFARVFRQEPVS